MQKINLLQINTFLGIFSTLCHKMAPKDQFSTNKNVSSEKYRKFLIIWRVIYYVEIVSGRVRIFSHWCPPYVTRGWACDIFYTISTYIYIYTRWSITNHILFIIFICNSIDRYISFFKSEYVMWSVYILTAFSFSIILLNKI